MRTWLWQRRRLVGARLQRRCYACNGRPPRGWRRSEEWLLSGYCPRCLFGPA